MQKCHLVSAVIITYNQEKYITQAIECALAQDVNFPYEIVIGDDCSTDKTLDICLKYQKKYPDIIRIITSDKNLGLIDNWYNSVKAARGKYIAGCGGDDYWHHPKKIQKQVDFLEKNLDYGMVHSDANIYWQEEKKMIKNFNATYRREKNKIESSKIFQSILNAEYPIWAGAMMFRKSLFDLYYDISEIKEKKFLMEDMPLWLEVTAHSKIYYQNESFYTYRRSRGTITNPECHQEKIVLCMSTYQCALFYFNKYNWLINDKKSVLSNIHSYYNHILMHMAVNVSDKKTIHQSYINIKLLSGQEYLKTIDHLCRFSASIPYGLKFFIIFRYISMQPLRIIRLFKRFSASKSASKF